MCFGAVCRGVVSDAVYDVVCCDAQGPPDADVQREVAAAMESVFPRVGLKAFMAISPPEKAGQVRTCSSVVQLSFMGLVGKQPDRQDQTGQTDKSTN